MDHHELPHHQREVPCLYRIQLELMVVGSSVSILDGLTCACGTVIVAVRKCPRAGSEPLSHKCPKPVRHPRCNVVLFPCSAQNVRVLLLSNLIVNASNPHLSRLLGVAHASVSHNRQLTTCSPNSPTTPTQSTSSLPSSTPSLFSSSRLRSCLS